MKVIGAGFGRTGTASLQSALEELGFGPCYHMYEVFEHPQHADFWEAAWRGEPVAWDEVLGSYEATVDWPACTFYEQLMERHQDAKVLLSVRDPEQWYESTRNTVYKLTKLSGRSPFSRVGLALLSLLKFGTFTIRPLQIAEEIAVQGTFGGRFEDKRYAIEVFNRHNEEVRQRVPEERLLIYEVKEGWGPLCEFLGVEEPDKPFPHRNDTAEVQRLILVTRILSVAIPTALALMGIAALVLLIRVFSEGRKEPGFFQGPGLLALIHPNAWKDDSEKYTDSLGILTPRYESPENAPSWVVFTSSTAILSPRRARR